MRLAPLHYRHSGHCGFAPVSSSLASGFTSYCVGDKMAAMMWTATSMDSSKGTGHCLNVLPPWIHERQFSCAVNTLAIVSLQYCSVNYQRWNNGQYFPNWCLPIDSCRSGFTTMPQEQMIIALCVAFFLCSSSIKAGDIVYEYGGQESLNVRTVSSGNSGNGNTLTRCICTQENTCKSQAQMKHNDGSGQIDIRIVTRPPVGLTCSGGLVYCCTNTSPQVTNTCGLREQINVPGVILQEGQCFMTLSKKIVCVMTLSKKIVCAMTLSKRIVCVMTLSKKIVSVMTLSKKIVSVMTLSKKIVCVMTLSKRIVCVMTLSKRIVSVMTLSKSSK
ncbi:unnamed protein product, partial [Timema podura]|nr:unnamed protein product [Timema podura]